MMAMVAIEFSKYGQRLFYEFDSLAQNFNMEDMVAFLEPHIGEIQVPTNFMDILALD